jgi:phosphinothricin acetyltransferase
MNTIGIRRATEADLDRITEIYAHSVIHGTATYELEPPTRAEMAARFAALQIEGLPYFVAEDEDGLAGYAYAGPFRTRPAYRFIVEDSIYLHPRAKGKGVGRMLLERLISEAKALGFRQMIAVIGDGSPGSPSVKLHERLGFRFCGTMEGSGFKHERWLDTVFMQLSMNGGSASAPDPQSLPERRFRGLE